MPTTTGGSGSKLTYTDFLAFPDDGMRHELIDGVHYVTPSPVLPHQRVIGNVYFLLRRHLEDHAGGMVYVSPVDVVFTMFDAPKKSEFEVQSAMHMSTSAINIPSSRLMTPPRCFLRRPWARASLALRGYRSSNLRSRAA